jgi:hypothetical protein
MFLTEAYLKQNTRGAPKLKLLPVQLLHKQHVLDPVERLLLDVQVPTAAGTVSAGAPAQLAAENLVPAGSAVRVQSRAGAQHGGPAR